MVIVSFYHKFKWLYKEINKASVDCQADVIALSHDGSVDCLCIKTFLILQDIVSTFYNKLTSKCLTFQYKGSVVLPANWRKNECLIIWYFYLIVTH